MMQLHVSGYDGQTICTCCTQTAGIIVEKAFVSFDHTCMMIVSVAWSDIVQKDMSTTWDLQVALVATSQ